MELHLPEVRLKHPRSLAARLVRRASLLDNVRGWRRIARSLAPADEQQDYVVRNGGVWFAGRLDSYIEREAYLFRGYESSAIDAFLKAVPSGRRQVAIDVGANVGTHTLRLAQAFAAVHSFEPNPRIFPRLRHNVELNGFEHVQLHPIGLGDENAEIDFHDVDSTNAGLGTFSSADQYDVELKVVGRVRVERADDYLPSRIKGRIDAVKIDVQGFEPQVLRGMQELLAQHRPYIWFEVSEPTRAAFGIRRELASLIPYDFSLSRFESGKAGLLNQIRLIEYGAETIELGDYLASPAGS